MTANSTNTYYPSFFIHKMSQNATGIHDINSALNADIFPNPAKDHFIIQFNEKIGNHAIATVFDMQGKVLISEGISKTQTRINISGLLRGTYIVKIQSGDRYAIKKLIVQ